MLSQQEETVVWKKTSKQSCYASRKRGSKLPVCSKAHDAESPYYHPLRSCIGGTQSRRWVPIEGRTIWSSRAKLNSSELKIYGVHAVEFSEDNINWNSLIKDYWSLLSPIVFSDHPKRTGDEDPSPPFNMLRNVLNMNAKFGGFNHALLEARKTGWVIIQDISSPIESARVVTAQLGWEARVIEIDTSSSDERILICYKPFFRTQLQ